MQANRKAVWSLPGQEYFKHYEGSEPFIFISYAHADLDEVMRIITDMHGRGFRLWYDEGIEAGEEWQESIASHLVDADLMIAFISNAFMASDNCRKEMSFALSKKKKVISIFLEDTALSPGMELQLGNIFAIMKYTYPSEGYFYTKLYDSDLLADGDYGCADREVNVPKKDERAAARLKREKERTKVKAEKKQTPRRKKKLALPIAIGLIIAVCAAAVITGYFTGYLQRFTAKTVKAQTLAGDTVAVFSSDVVERAARQYTGKTSGDITVSELTGLTSLYIAGDKYWFQEPLSGVSAETADTSAYVTDNSGNTISVSRGDMTGFEDFQYFPSLTTLWVQFENITSLETMPACSIENLNIASNRVTSLKGINNCPRLGTLCTDGCPLSDISTLDGCIDLSSVSFRGANISDLSPLRYMTKFDFAALSGCTLSELTPLLKNHHMSSLSLTDCDLRGSFFMSFDREKKITAMSLTGCKLDSLTDIQDFTSLTELTIRSCEGISDWSPLLGLTALEELNIDRDMSEQMQSVTAAAAFKVVTQN